MPVGRAELVRIERLVEVLVAEHELVRVCEPKVVLPQILMILRVEAARIDAVLLDVRAVLPCATVKCVVQLSVSLPFANTDAERTRSCDSLRSVGTP